VLLQNIICNMKSPSSSLSEQISLQIAEIDRQILELQRERQIHQRMMARALANDAAQTQVSRRNSVNRILVEKAILDLLRQAPERTFSSSKISQAARGIIPSIKPATLRSYLHRLKSRGLIRPSHSHRGHWGLALETTSKGQANPKQI
jgi:chorismate mutase